MDDLESLRTNDNIKLKILLGLFTVIFIVFMFPKGESIESEVTIGSIWIHDDLIASFSFPVYKDPVLYKNELKQSVDAVYPIFVKVDNIERKISDSLKFYNAFIPEILDKNNQSFLSENSLDRTRHSITESPHFAGFLWW